MYPLYEHTHAHTPLQAPCPPAAMHAPAMPINAVTLAPDALHALLLSTPLPLLPLLSLPDMSPAPVLLSTSPLLPPTESTRSPMPVPPVPTAHQAARTMATLSLPAIPAMPSLSASVVPSLLPCPLPDDQQSMPDNQAFRWPQGLILTAATMHVANVPPIQPSTLPGLPYIPAAAPHSPSTPSAPVPKPLHAPIFTESPSNVPLLALPLLPSTEASQLPTTIPLPHVQPLLRSLFPTAPLIPMPAPVLRHLPPHAQVLLRQPPPVPDDPLAMPKEEAYCPPREELAAMLAALPTSIPKPLPTPLTSTPPPPVALPLAAFPIALPSPTPLALAVPSLSPLPPAALPLVCLSELAIMVPAVTHITAALPMKLRQSPTSTAFPPATSNIAALLLPTPAALLSLPVLTT
ncbi:hypothetical protein AX14_002969, partial [Amanita brunnescens Koide BX004]